MKSLTRSLPLLLTAGNLLCGLSALFLLSAPTAGAEAGHRAILCIFAAWGLDLMDGPLARRLRVESEFGKYADMLADVVSFAVAPALLAVTTILAPAGLLSYGCAALFTLCGAFRLARFALLSRDRRHTDHFTGLPLPAAAALLCGLILLASPASFLSRLWVAGGLLLLSGLMVSRVLFPTFRHPAFARTSKFFLILALAATLLAVVLDIRLLLILFLAYLITGLLITRQEARTKKEPASTSGAS